jgi:hypothetical protein
MTIFAPQIPGNTGVFVAEFNLFATHRTLNSAALNSPNAARGSDECLLILK